MKKKMVFLALSVMLAVLLSVSGCGRKEEESTSYTIYYKNSAGTSLYEVDYIPSAETFDEMMAELMEQMITVSADSTYVSALPETVVYQGYERGIDALRVDFSSEYYDMSNTEEVLLRAAVVKTICQIPGVTKVMITIDSEQLTDADGELVAAMDAESFIDTKNGGINSYQTASLILYFPNQDGDMLKKEVRSVHYSSNMVLERVIVEQLIAGSDYSNRRSVFRSDVEILDISTKNGICTINFSEEFNEAPSENPPSAKAALYAIVNSVCETSDDIGGVKFAIEGSSNVTFRGEIDLNDVFMMNQDMIEMETLESETEQVNAEEAADTVSDSSATEASVKSSEQEVSEMEVSASETSAPETEADGAESDASVVVSDASAGTEALSTETQTENPVTNDQVLAGAE